MVLIILLGSDNMSVPIDMSTAADMNIEIIINESGNVVNQFVPVYTVPSAILKKVVEWVTYLKPILGVFYVGMESTHWYQEFFNVDFRTLVVLAWAAVHFDLSELILHVWMNAVRLSGGRSRAEVLLMFQQHIIAYIQD